MACFWRGGGPTWDRNFAGLAGMCFGIEDGHQNLSGVGQFAKVKPETAKPFRTPLVSSASVLETMIKQGSSRSRLSIIGTRLQW